MMASPMRHPSLGGDCGGVAGVERGGGGKGGGNGFEGSLIVGDGDT